MPRAVSLAAAAALIGAAVPLTVEARSPEVAFAPGVLNAWYLTKAAPAYQIARRFEVRADPDPESPTTMILHGGEIVEAAAMTEDGWIAVSENGVIQGYVPASIMRPIWSAPPRYATR